MIPLQFFNLYGFSVISIKFPSASSIRKKKEKKIFLISHSIIKHFFKKIGNVVIYVKSTK